MTAGAALALASATVMALLGLPPIDLHNPLHKIGIMDPLCGGTRAARYAVQGNLAEAWRYNPLSIFILLAAGLATLRAAVGLLARPALGECLAGVDPASATLGGPHRHQARGVAGDQAADVRRLLMAGTHTWV